MKMPSLYYANNMEALKAGPFYLSSGPEICEAKIVDNVLTVKTSKVQKIYVVTDGRNCYKKVAEDDAGITEAAFELSGKDKWIHIIIEDEKRQHAGTNAYFMD